MSKFLTPKFIIIFLFTLIIMFVYYISSKFIDVKFNDFITKISVNLFNNKSSDNIVLVVIDEKSIKTKSWPWTKDLYLNIFEYIEKYCGAKAIVYKDLILFPDSYNPEKDTLFFENLLKFNNLINSYIFLNSSKTSDLLPTEYIEIFDSKSKIKIIDKRTKKLNFQYKGIVKLPKELIENASQLAASALIEDNDKIVRFYMPVFEFNNKLYPSLALAAYSLYKGINEFVLYDNFLCSNDNCSSLKVPIISLKKQDYFTNDVQGIFYSLKWYKPKGKYFSHKTYSAIDVINSYNAVKSGQEPLIGKEAFENKIVLFGLSTDDDVWEQMSETPVLKKHSDIDIHAVMIDNLISSSSKNTSKNNMSIIITMIFCLFILRGYKNLKSNIIFTSILSCIYFGYYLIDLGRTIYAAPVSPILTMFAAAFLKKLYEILTIDKNTEMIKRAMGKYISKDVMAQVITNLDKLKVGGIRTTVTVLFVDIRNFTGISEELSPQDVTKILNEYFSVIEPIIAKYHGIINKYMGDGVLAIFGEPIHIDNPPLNAVKCSTEIIEKVKNLREKFIQEGKPKIEIGIGINTGEVFAGNIGTDERLEYTVIGDNVNLAYRIEALNQVLKTQFLISQYTYEYIKNNIEVVKLSQMVIKGKSKPIDIYEVLKIRNE